MSTVHNNHSMKTTLAFALMLGFLAVSAAPTNAPTVRTNVVLVRPTVALTQMQSEYLALTAANDAMRNRMAADRKAAALAYRHSNQSPNTMLLNAHRPLVNQISRNTKTLNALLFADPTLKNLPAQVARAQSKLVKSTNVVDEAAEAKRQAELDEAVKKFRSEQAASAAP